LVLSPLSCTSPEKRDVGFLLSTTGGTAGTSPSAYRSRF
jgi:hypothetical protein